MNVIEVHRGTSMDIPIIIYWEFVGIKIKSPCFFKDLKLTQYTPRSIYEYVRKYAVISIYRDTIR